MGSDVEVTEADREKAAEVVEKIAGVPWDVFSDAEWVWVGHVAQALAEERAKAQAPLLALADEAERKGRESSFRDFAGNPWPAHIYPHDIRRAAGRPA